MEAHLIEVNGCLNKAFYTDESGAKYLVKGNQNTKRGFTYEPYSEVMACRIAHVLGVKSDTYYLDNSSKYADVKTFGINHVSVCKIAKNQQGEQRIALDDLVSLDKKFRGTLLEFMKLNGLLTEDFIKLIVFDAVIGNTDRHTRNIEFVFSKDGKIRLSNVFDSGASLLSTVTDYNLSCKSTSIGVDIAKPFRDTHEKQINLLSKYAELPKYSKIAKNVIKEQAVGSITDIINLLPVKRREAIITVLRNRIDRFL